MSSPAVPPAERGSLEVKAKAIESTVRIAAAQHPDTRGHRSPKVDLTLRNGRAWIDVDVTAPWPCSASELATRVRDDLRVEVERLTSISVERLDVLLRVALSGRAGS